MIVVGDEQRELRPDQRPHPPHSLAVSLGKPCGHHRPVQSQQQPVQRQRGPDRIQQFIDQRRIRLRFHRPRRRGVRAEKRHDLVTVLLRAGHEAAHLVEGRPVMLDDLRAAQDPEIVERCRKGGECIRLMAQRCNADAHGWIPLFLFRIALWEDHQYNQSRVGRPLMTVIICFACLICNSA